MSKITTDSSTRSGTGCCTHMITVGIKGLTLKNKQCENGFGKTRSLSTTLHSSVHPRAARLMTNAACKAHPYAIFVVNGVAGLAARRQNADCVRRAKRCLQTVIFRHTSHLVIKSSQNRSHHLSTSPITATVDCGAWSRLRAVTASRQVMRQFVCNTANHRAAVDCSYTDRIKLQNIERIRHRIAQKRMCNKNVINIATE